MTVQKVMITNGTVIGAVVDDAGKEKKARLSDLQKLLEKGKITSGARLINGEVIIDIEVLKRKAAQPVFVLGKLIKDNDGNLIGVELSDGKQVDVKTAWSLAADDRLTGLQAAYMKDIDSKVVMSV